MNIGIIGAGQIGGTLTRRLTALGHKVFVAKQKTANRNGAQRKQKQHNLRNRVSC
jgi:predicted dinucleotide-binding enzyme